MKSSGRSKKRLSKPKSGVSFALANFQSLPNEARVDIAVVQQLFGIGQSTVWAWLKQQRLPQPAREGRTTRWTVGSLRAKLAGAQ